MRVRRWTYREIGVEQVLHVHGLALVERAREKTTPRWNRLRRRHARRASLFLFIQQLKRPPDIRIVKVDVQLFCLRAQRVFVPLPRA